MNPSNIFLEHVNMPVRDLSQSLRFYQELFPHWRVRWEGQSYHGGKWIHFGDRSMEASYLSIWENPNAERTPSPSVACLQIQHIGFRYPDVGALVTRLRESGIEPSDLVEEGGFRRAYFTDPDGHELEFIEGLA